MSNSDLSFQIAVTVPGQSLLENSDITLPASQIMGWSDKAGVLKKNLADSKKEVYRRGDVISDQSVEKAKLKKALANSEKRETDLLNIVKAGLVITEGIGMEIGTNPLHHNDPDSTGEDILMALALKFKLAALEALKEAVT